MTGIPPPLRPQVAPCKASVMLKAYNHERFIAQAIDSALAQQTEFPYEILIGEDCSTDGTRSIVLEYAARHPDRIRVLASERNLGMVGSTMALYAACRGEYIAWLDGDDYWISTDKLQRQVDFLNAHREYTLCYHDSLVLEPGGRAHRHSLATPGQTTYTIVDLLVGPLGFAGSCVYRKVLAGFPPWFEHLPYSDWPLQLLHAERGLAAWLPGLLSVYRADGTSEAALGYNAHAHRTIYEFWAGRQAAVYDAFNRHSSFRYDRLIRTELMKIGPRGQRVYRVTPRWSRLRSLAWRLVRRRPALARAALAAGGLLAAIAERVHRPRVSSDGSP